MCINKIPQNLTIEMERYCKCVSAEGYLTVYGRVATAVAITVPYMYIIRVYM